MFKFLALFILVTSIHVTGTADEIQFPILGYNNDKGIYLSSLNAKLKKIGSLISFPNYIIIYNSTSFKELDSIFNKLNSDLESANTLLKTNYDHGFGWNLSFYVDKRLKYPLCYRGQPSTAVDTIRGLLETFLSENYGIWAWKFKNETKFEVVDTQEELNNENVHIPKKWFQWISKNNSILFLSRNSECDDNFMTDLVIECT